MSCLGIIFATKFAKIRTSIVVLFQFDPYNVPFYISTNPTIEYKCLRIHKLIIKQLLMGVCKSRNPTRNTRNPPGTPGTPPEHPEPYPEHPEHPEPFPEHPEPHPEHPEPHPEHAGIRAMQQRTCFSINSRVSH